MRFHCLGQDLDLQYRGPNRLYCDASYSKGEELGYFQQGSTIIVFASSDFELHETIRNDHMIKMGEPLLQRSNPPI
jgi:phosphatidylserine decarboxylase